MDKRDYARSIAVSGVKYTIFDINRLEEKGVADIRSLPFSIKILVENLLRKLDGVIVKEENLLDIAQWKKQYGRPVEIPFHPARVLMQDFTGVPAVVDLACMREAVRRLGGNPKKINPLVPVELIVDHSIQLDYFGTADSLTKNVQKEYERNSERYALLKWAQKSFDNFKVVPPNSGICHQVNLEYLGRVVISESLDGQKTAYPDTLVGTDSHTTMINGIGVMGWGVGGIEAEAVMLGQPYYMSIPEVIGFRMTGELKEGVTATDLVLTITEILRRHNVVEKFVEFFGPGMKNLSLPDRATIANMSPEYGATMGFFPVDEKTLAYLKMTDRESRAALVEACTKELGLFYTGNFDPEYSQVVELDLPTVSPSVAGPARPQDRLSLADLKTGFETILAGAGSRQKKTAASSDRRIYPVNINGHDTKIGDGSIVIAAITSCTNTSNPYVMLGAGLVAKNAVNKGIQTPSYVKTSLAPGSKVVLDYLSDAGMMPYLEALGFHLAGFGCTTCIGNSGPLHPNIEKIIKENNLTVAAVLSGNRNFEARIHQSVTANFLASPMLVVVLALAGRMDIDLAKEPVNLNSNGEPVYLEDLWPAYEEIDELVRRHVRKEFYAKEYAKIFDGDEFWHRLPVMDDLTYQWDEASTYIKNPPYFQNFKQGIEKSKSMENGRALLLLGDSVTTDHISPAGAIPEKYPAGRYLIEKKVPVLAFNSYGSRRGNHEVMMRGTFGNIRIKNQLVKPKEGSYTLKFPEDEEMFVFDAAVAYMQQGIPLVVLGGREYGTGSSRDWAAKGTNLLGIKAVIAESFERIHRSNLVGMGVLPLVFDTGESWESIGLDGTETYSIQGIEGMRPQKKLQVKALKKDGREIHFQVTVRLDTEVDVAYFEHGGILPYVLRKLLSSDRP